MADPSRFWKGGALRMEPRSGVENPSTRQPFLAHFCLAQKKKEEGFRLPPDHDFVQKFLVQKLSA
jgi:hypothetical protein